MKLNHLDLFSGIGGFSLGLERTGGFRTIGFCETDAYCTKVLQKNFPGIPIHGDIRKLKGTDFGAVDIITGGYPCQPFSVAGKQKGVEDKRHLWPEYFRIIKESRPAWVIGENVAGHLKLGLDSVLKDLESEGYSARTFSISASSIGANHQRERIWIIAHSDKHGSHSEKTHEAKQGGNGKENGLSFRNDNDVPNSDSQRTKGFEKNKSLFKDGGDEIFSNELQKPTKIDVGGNGYSGGSNKNVADSLKGHVQAGRERQREIRQGHQEEGFSGDASSSSEDMADTERIGQQGQGKPVRSSDTKKNQNGKTSWTYDGSQGSEGWWDIEPDVGRVAHGIPKRVDRLKCLGNSLIPMIPFLIGRSIMEAENA